MADKLRFEGIKHVVKVDFGDPHSSHEAVTYAFDEHRPVISIESDDGLVAGEILAKLGEHRFSCEKLLRNEGKMKGY